jgi:hypothetical protein
MKYTYSEEEDGGSDALSTRRSNRQSGISTPAEPSGPTFTASGRQVRSRHGGAYGESILSGQADTAGQLSVSGMDGADDGDDELVAGGRPRRAAQQNGTKPKAHSRKPIDGYNALDSMEDETDASSSGGEWDGEDDDEPDDIVEDDEDEDVEMSDGEAKQSSDEEESDTPRSLVVSLRYMKTHSSPPPERMPAVTTIPTSHYSLPKAPTVIETPPEPSMSALDVPRLPLKPLQTSAATKTPSDAPIPVLTVPQYSQPLLIPAKSPTYSFDPSSAYDRPQADASPSKAPTHTLHQDVPHTRESILVPNHTVQPQPEAKAPTPQQLNSDAEADGLRQ